MGILGSYEWIDIQKYDGAVAPNENNFTTIDTLRNPNKEVEEKSYRRLTTAINVNDTYYTVRLYEEVASWEHISRTILLSVLAGLLIWILLLYILNQFVLDKVLAPFYKTVSTLEHISNPSDLNETFPDTSTYEINVLNRALNTMMQHIRSSFEDQKQFIQNASHELLTPLSIIRQKAEKILSNADALDKQTIKAAGQIQDTSVRLSRLSNALLLISRVENRQYSLDEVVEITDIAENVIQELSDFIEMKDLILQKEFDCSINVQGNSELIQSAIYNIVQNAIKYTPSGSSITLKISCEDEQRSFSVLDEGPGIPENLINSVFDRFQKTENHTDGFDNDSPGLGLSIVQSICRLHGFRCSAQNRSDKGAEVSIQF
ncbi:HAMP domain-containing sensor histidine kinase [Fodinibius sp.]|uniref:sensor histidine kinase n=1 Tax=Fodinibius sp. TaxID=1872440 RepID=UPI002ACECA1A|nr:HAMP domain-containing sensor histidine kinase [Fodinibius sp.]MDZ7657684.1 HAMP domain-containing sensor histidine kinase [Fodinibius sp.]